MAEKIRKVKTYIPTDQLNPKNKTFEITVNGKTYRIARGVPVELDENIFDILQEHLMYTAQINISKITEHDN